jgi:hypothetical protein
VINAMFPPDHEFEAVLSAIPGSVGSLALLPEAMTLLQMFTR